MINQFPLKTCLRYAGGKSKALKTLAPWFPNDFKEYREPFVGGGSVALLISQNYPSIPIWINDKYYYLYNFWIHLRDCGLELSNKLKSLKLGLNDDVNTHRELFNDYSHVIGDLEPLDKAVAFYFLNKCSYSGLTENSNFSKTAALTRFTLTGIEKLPAFSKIIQNWKITNLDYSQVMNEPGENVFLFLDPPYDIKNFIYGTKGDMHSSFSHSLFANRVDECPHKFMITYNLNDWFVERYKNYYQKEWNIQYSMIHRDKNLKKELLITNYNTDVTLFGLSTDTPEESSNVLE